MERSAFEKLTNLIEDAKTTMTDGDYMEMMKAMKTIHDKNFFATTTNKQVRRLRVVEPAPVVAPVRVITCSGCQQQGHNRKSQICPINQRRNRIYQEFTTAINPFLKKGTEDLWQANWDTFVMFREETKFDVKNITEEETTALIDAALRIVTRISKEWIVSQRQQIAKNRSLCERIASQRKWISDQTDLIDLS